ncbi:NACHT and WD40 repeat domain-containing protein [Actinoplanes lobatus]|nr:hypothetical protein [Actinoplanes lobatus]MBB4746726.1 WD40 repeat protein [Actinoplanes lobatus]
MRRLARRSLMLAVLFFAGWIAVEARHGRLEPVGLLGLVLAMASLAVDITGLRLDRGQPGPSAADRAAELAGILLEQWREEAGARGLYDPELLPFAWTERDPRAPRSPGGTGRFDGRIRGGFDAVAARLAAAFAGLPVRRLVVIGQPGAGKSIVALLLEMGLLQARAGEREPVPVLVTVSSWDPLTDDLDGYLVRSLATAHYDGRTEIPRQLLRAGLLIPVLDGLDEIPEAVRGAAVVAINEAIGADDRPVVVTCRAVEYEDLISAGAPPLRRATVVGVQPVQPRDAIEYLSAVEWPEGTEWGPFFAELDRPGSVVAAAYSTPLLVTIARTVYQRRGGDPSEQLGYESRLDLENGLFDRLIDAAYADSRAGGATWPPDRAAGYLRFLARYLHRHRDRDLHWWRLADRLLSPWSGLILGVGSGLAVLVLTTVVAVVLDAAQSGVAPISDLPLAILIILLVTIVWPAGSGRPPTRLSFRGAGSWRRLRRGFGFGMALSLLLGLPVLTIEAASVLLNSTVVPGDGLLLMTMIGAATGIASALATALAVHAWLQAPPLHARRVTPVAVLAGDRRSAIVSAGAVAVVVVVAVMPCLAVGMTAGALAGSMASGGAGWPGRFAPLEVFAVTVAKLSPDSAKDARNLIGFLLLCGTLLAALVLLTTAWFRFQVVRATYAIRGILPWRLTRFLEDARNREVLRQTGGVYQFRHIRLQERLADQQVARPEPVRVRRRRLVLAGLSTLLLLFVVAVPLAATPGNGARQVLSWTYGDDPVSVTMSPGGDTVAIRTERRLRLHRLAAGGGSLPDGIDIRGRTWHFSADGSLVVTDPGKYERPLSEGFTEVWRTATSQRLAGGRRSEVEVVGAGDGYGMRAADGLVLYDDRGERQGELRARDVRCLPCPDRLDIPEGAAVEAGHGRFLIGTGNAGLIVRDTMDRGRAPTVLRDPGGGPADASINAGGTRLLVRGRHGARLFDLENGRRIATLDFREARSVLAFSPDGDRVVGFSGGSDQDDADDNRARLWSAVDGAVIMSRTGVYGRHRVYFAHTGRTVVLGATPAGGEVQVWRLSDGAVLSRVRQVVGYGLYLGPDASLLVAGNRVGRQDAVRLQVVDAANGAALPTKPVVAPEWKLDWRAFDVGRERDIGRFTEGTPLVLPTADGKVMAWDLRLGRPLGDRQSRITVSPVGGAFAVEHPGSGITLYRAAGGPRTELVKSKPVDEGAPADGWLPEKRVAFSADGRYVAVNAKVSDDDFENETYVQVWHVDSGCRVAELTGHDGGVVDFTWGLGGTSGRVITVGADHTARVWDVPAAPDC